MTGNKKSFTMNSVTVKAFSFILNSFDSAVTFLFRIKQKIPITFISSAKVGAVTNITLKKIKITITNIKLIFKLIQPLNIKKIKITIIPKEIGKIVQALSIKKVVITLISKATQKLISGVILKKIKLGFVGTYGTFYTLGTYDPQTLGTLDTQTLGALDFTLIT
jgi:hypothetical protein